MSERKSYRRTIQEVIDGNTFRVRRRVEGSRYIRVAGLSSPEEGEAGFEKAKKRLGRIKGKVVTIRPLARTSGRRTIARVIYDGKNIAEPANIRDAYETIYEWANTLGKEIRKQSDLSENYREASEKLIRELPQPQDALSEDMAFVAWEVLTGLLEWAYHSLTETQTPLHKYARFIAERAEKAEIDLSKSSLNAIRQTYLAMLE